MAERRMFAKMVITSDDFLDMPLSARCLYFSLGMFADDDGFVNNPKSIVRQVGVSQDDLEVLINKQYIILFETGVVVIKHWFVHNAIRKDTYKETRYMNEKKLLQLDSNNEYHMCDKCGSSQVRNEAVTKLSQVRNEMSPQDRIGKDSIGKDSIDKISVSTDTTPNGGKHPRFRKPTVEEIRAYCKERRNNIDAQRFFDFYESKGWLVGRSPMKDWKACVRTWEKGEHQLSTPQTCLDNADDDSDGGTIL